MKRKIGSNNRELMSELPKLMRKIWRPEDRISAAELRKRLKRIDARKSVEKRLIQ